MSERLGNYIAAMRKQAGLTQLQLARIIGYRDRNAVSSHERSRSLPPLIIAIAYSVALGKPVSEIFAGLTDLIERTVESELTKFKHELNQPKGRSGTTARAQQWVSQRMQPQQNDRGP